MNEGQSTALRFRTGFTCDSRTIYELITGLEMKLFGNTDRQLKQSRVLRDYVCAFLDERLVGIALLDPQSYDPDNDQTEARIELVGMDLKRESQ